MSEHDDGGPAAPTPILDDGGVVGITPGMTLRDLFAAQALAGMLSNPATTNVTHIGDIAYAFADAMLAARRP